MSELRLGAHDFARRWREQGPKAAFASLREILRVQAYLEDEIVVRKDFARDTAPAPGPVRLELAQAHHFVDAFNTPARWLWTTSGYTVVTRLHTHRILRRFVIVEDEGRRHSILDAVRPFVAIGFSGRRD